MACPTNTQPLSPTPPPLLPAQRTEPMVTLKLIVYCWVGFAGNELLWINIGGCQLLFTRLGIGVLWRFQHASGSRRALLAGLVIGVRYFWKSVDPLGVLD